MITFFFLSLNLEENSSRITMYQSFMLEIVVKAQRLDLHDMVQMIPFLIFLAQNRSVTWTCKQEIEIRYCQIRNQASFIHGNKFDMNQMSVV